MSATRFSSPPAGFGRLVVCLALLALTGAAQAQWKWRDASGKLQYSDLPPPSGVAEKDILQRPPTQRPSVVVLPVGGQTASAPAAAASVAPARSEAEVSSRKKLEQEQAAQRAEEERKVKAQKAENCKTAQGQLRLLEDGVRITRKDERGERVFLNDQQRAEETKRARAIIAVDCAN